MQAISEGSVRVDLVGGTLDLEPIHLILKNVVTINLATSLKARVKISDISFNGVRIHSLDYDKVYEFAANEFSADHLHGDHFKEMTFICQILDMFGIHSGVEVELSSGSPPSAGLGGSSSMGMTLYKALSEYQGKKIDDIGKAITKVKAIEGRILGQGIPGYQDYYPAMIGGVLCLKPAPGEVLVEQLYTPELKTFLEDHITLVYSGISRDSGINNWDVYKKFFDGDTQVRTTMAEIADISFRAYQAIKAGDYQQLLTLIAAEGECRKALAKTIVPSEVDTVAKKLQAKFGQIGLKMCGAGGGGCFILTHPNVKKSEIHSELSKTSMKVLDFSVCAPLQ